MTQILFYPRVNDDDDDDDMFTFLRLSEATVRSQKQAECEDCHQVDIEHFEKILPQLVWSDTHSTLTGHSILLRTHNI